MYSLCNALQSYLFTATKDESLTLLTLSNELSSVPGWYMLGLNLGVAPDQLDAIKTSPVMLSGDEKRTEMLNIWLKNSQGASWQKVVTALKNIREVRLAEAIEKKHPASPGESHARIHPGQLILCSGIHQGYSNLLLKLEVIDLLVSGYKTLHTWFALIGIWGN